MLAASVRAVVLRERPSDPLPALARHVCAHAGVPLAEPLAKDPQTPTERNELQYLQHHQVRLEEVISKAIRVGLADSHDSLIESVGLHLAMLAGLRDESTGGSPAADRAASLDDSAAAPLSGELTRRGTPTPWPPPTTKAPPSPEPAATSPAPPAVAAIAPAMPNPWAPNTPAPLVAPTPHAPPTLAAPAAEPPALPPPAAVAPTAAATAAATATAAPGVAGGTLELSPVELKARYAVDSGGRTIASTARATVRAVADTATGEEVAVKMVDCTHSGFVEWVRKECLVLESVHEHPHVVALLAHGAGAGAQAEVYHVVMELLPTSLYDELAALRGPLPPERARRLFAQLIEAVAHCQAC